MTREELNEKISLDALWQSYLEASRIPEAHMSLNQKQETMKALVFSRLHTLLILEQDIAELPDDDGTQLLETMLGQSIDFFKMQDKKQHN